MAEWSTLFLNVRIIYRQLGKTETAISGLFALTFFVTRIVAFGGLLLHLLSQLAELKQLLSLPLQVSYFGLLPAMYCLNLFWFYKICQGVARVLSGSDADDQCDDRNDASKSK